MTDILGEISAYAHIRVEKAKEHVPIEKMKDMATRMKCDTGFPFERNLSSEGMSFICEVKRASPSKGSIVKDLPYLEIAKDYEKAGASAISVLTEPKWFKGENGYLSEISSNVSIPCLRKDFIVDEYMIYEAKVLGASAILLICAILTDDQLRSYIKTAEDLGLSALVEAHDRSEVERAVKAGARIIGVNNRDLRTFEVDLNNSVRLSEFIPDDIIFVAESGISRREDVVFLERNGVDAVLIGETLMRSEDRTAKLNELRGCK